MKLEHLWDSRVKCVSCGNPLSYWPGSPMDFYDAEKLCPKCQASKFVDESLVIIKQRLDGTND